MTRRYITPRGVLVGVVTLAMWPLYRWPRWLEDWQSSALWDEYRKGIR
jgi:hypothetical protein